MEMGVRIISSFIDSEPAIAETAMFAWFILKIIYFNTETKQIKIVAK